jgi:aminopeptidase N
MKFTVAAFVLSALLLAWGAAQGAELPRYELSVAVDPENALLTGQARITLPGGGKVLVERGALDLESASLDGRPLALEKKGPLVLEDVAPGAVLTIAYRGVFPGEELVPGTENVGMVQGAFISPGGVSLTSGWYPALEGMALYSLTATVPRGYAALSEADGIEREETAEGVRFTFAFPHPVPGISLAAGPYLETSDTLDGISIHGYFFAEDAHLAPEYVRYARHYIELYQGLIGPYPYKRFSVVENVLPSGYSMPTYTLLGREVVRLPFIVETSLGHEVLHQWFGNSVYADYSRGNWLEGIATYLADHLYKAREGKGAEYRKTLLLNYRNYVHPENDIPLTAFRSRTGLATGAIGYGKAAMVFHMLRGEVGEKAFYGALGALYEKKKFERASWDDVRAAFEEASGTDLGWFFKQWLTRKDVPVLRVRDACVLVLDGKPQVTFRLVQEGEPYRLKVPVRVVSAGGETTSTVRVEKGSEEVSITADAGPRELIVDGGYDLMRALSEEETPPVVSALTGAEKRLVVFPSDEKKRETYAPLMELLMEHGFGVKPDDEVKEEDLETSSTLVLGFDSPVLRQFLAGPPKPAGEGPGGGFVLSVMENPLNPDGVLAAAHGASKEEVALAAPKIMHYGNYSTLRFQKGTNVEKALSQRPYGIREDVSFRAFGFAPARALSLKDIIERIIDTDIIYVGETHPNYADHKVQLAVIEALHREGRAFAIGMEMFQRPYQPSLDAYISGDIGVRDFLKDTEYYERWGFNYNLYREILDYARTYGIPVVALNQASEVVKKVADGGLDALTPEEREKIPPDMDMTDDAYRRRLRTIFEAHRKVPGRTFTNFYQAQVLWDETMAHSVADFLKENPGYQMVVIAGQGHVAYGSGIPRRAHRLNGKPYAIVLNPSGEDWKRDIADYVFFPQQLSAPQTPLIGVAVEKKEKGLTVTRVRPGSPAAKAGLKKDDVILEAGGFAVKSFGDLKAALFGRKAGETVALRILRPRALAPDKEMEVTVTIE